MRITVVGLNYWPEVTGIAPYTTGLAEGLVRRGHQVTVLTGVPHYPEWRVDPRFPPSRYGPELVNGVAVRRLRHRVPTVPDKWGRISMELSLSRALMRADLATPDVIIAISPSLLSTAAALMTSRSAPVGIVVQDLYGPGVIETATAGGRMAKAVEFVESRVLRRASGISVIHPRFIDYLTRIGVEANKITVSRNWVHVDRADRLETTAATRRRLGWSAHETVVLHAGNMGNKQGLENVVDAARLAQNRNAAVRFVLLGDGNQRRRLEESASGIDLLEIRDLLPESEFRAALSAADILLVNEHEGLKEMAVPSKLTTYFEAGKPIVAAVENDGATAGELCAANAGVILPAGKPAALLSTIEELAADPAEMERLGRAGVRYAEEVLQSDAALDKYAAWIEHLGGVTGVRQRRRAALHQVISTPTIAAPSRDRTTA